MLYLSLKLEQRNIVDVVIIDERRIQRKLAPHSHLLPGTTRILFVQFMLFRCKFLFEVSSLFSASNENTKIRHLHLSSWEHGVKNSVQLFYLHKKYSLGDEISDFSPDEYLNFKGPQASIPYNRFLVGINSSSYSIPGIDIFSPITRPKIPARKGNDHK